MRDKLLNLDSDDIDIALDNMLGKDFAEHVNEYLVSQNSNAQKVGANAARQATLCFILLRSRVSINKLASAAAMIAENLLNLNLQFPPLF